MISTKDAAERYVVSRSTIRRWSKEDGYCVEYDGYGVAFYAEEEVLKSAEKRGYSDHFESSDSKAASTAPGRIAFIHDLTLSGRYHREDGGGGVKVELYQDGSDQTIALTAGLADGDLFDEDSVDFLYFAISDAIADWNQGRS